MTLINISNVNLSITEVQPGYAPPEIITTDYLRKLCAQMDSQAFYAAIVGFILALMTIIYYGRIRHRLEAHVASFFDKLLLVGIAMCFAVILVRLLRAG